MSHLSITRRDALLASAGLAVAVPSTAPAQSGIASAAAKALAQEAYVFGLPLDDPDSYFVPNPINRYSRSSRDDMKFNDDGSLTIYVQQASPVPTRKRTGCRRPQTSSEWPCDSTGPSRRPPTEPGSRRRWSG